MPRRLLACLALALLLSACATSSSSPRVGDPAIPFTALDSNRRPVSLEAFRGQKNVVLVFYIGHT